MFYSAKFLEDQVILVREDGSKPIEKFVADVSQAIFHHYRFMFTPPKQFLAAVVAVVNGINDPRTDDAITTYEEYVFAVSKVISELYYDSTSKGHMSPGKLTEFLKPCWAAFKVFCEAENHAFNKVNRKFCPLVLDDKLKNVLEGALPDDCHPICFPSMVDSSCSIFIVSTSLFQKINKKEEFDTIVNRMGDGDLLIAHISTRGSQQYGVAFGLFNLNKVGLI